MTTLFIVLFFCLLSFVAGLNLSSYIHKNLVRFYFAMQGMHWRAIEDHTETVLGKRAWTEILRWNGGFFKWTAKAKERLAQYEANPNPNYKP